MTDEPPKEEIALNGGARSVPSELMAKWNALDDEDMLIHLRLGQFNHLANSYIGLLESTRATMEATFALRAGDKKAADAELKKYRANIVAAYEQFYAFLSEVFEAELEARK